MSKPTVEELFEAEEILVSKAREVAQTSNATVTYTARCDLRVAAIEFAAICDRIMGASDPIGPASQPKSNPRPSTPNPKPLKGPLSGVALAQIAAERQRQIAQWGGEEHDDDHTRREWVALIREHVDRARKVDTDRDAWRQRVVVIAALAIAALESWDRGGGAGA